MQVVTLKERGLPSAPKFGPDGAWPPVSTKWKPVRVYKIISDIFFRGDLDEAAACIVAANRSELIDILTSARYSTKKSLEKAVRSLLLDSSRESEKEPESLVDPFARGILHKNYLGKVLGAARPNQIAIELIGVKAGKPSRLSLVVVNRAGHKHSVASGPPETLRRVVHYQRWQRKDPITQLPPGASHEMTHSLTTGLSVEHSQALAASLGLSLGGGAAGVHASLNSQLQQQFGLKVNINAQSQTSVKLTLTNQNDHGYRLYSLWHVDNRITVDTLSLPLPEPDDGEGLGDYSRDDLGYWWDDSTLFLGSRSTWKPIQNVEFVTDSEPHVTYAEVGRV